MNVKKVISILLLVILLVMQFNFIIFIQPVTAITDTKENDVKIENGHYRYYYTQLTDNAKKIYDAMQYMYEHNMLKNGTTNYDLTENNYVTAELLNSYIKGSNDLIVAFENARDAFYMDYPEIFYINMEKYSLRVTIDAKKNYHLYLGTGNNESYMIQGFNSVDDVNTAITNYDVALKNIIDGAKAFEKDYSGKELVKKQIEYVHDKVIENAKYKLDNECAEINRGHIRTPYGVLIAHEAVCEGYSKTVKVALDNLGIPCILVRGTYTHEDGRIEGHMWNYVQIEDNEQKKWYAVDSTFDDYDGQYSYNDYLLVGYSTMIEGHKTNGIMSASEFEFKYPELEYEDYGITKAYDYNGLGVGYTVFSGETDDSNKVTGGKFLINYKQMGIEEAKRNGLYFLVRYGETPESCESGTWYYMEPLRNGGSYVDGIIDERAKDFIFYDCNFEYLEFAVTDVLWKEPVKLNQDYRGTEEHIIVKSDIVNNYAGYYKPAPDIVEATPYNCSKLKPGKKTRIKITYNQKLSETNDGVKPGIKLTCNAWTSSGEDNSKVEYIGHDNYSVWFDFTPSKMWGDNSVFYKFNVEGLVGEWSGKTPRPSTYYVQETFGCTYSMAQAKAWRIYGRPTLIDNANIDLTGWELSDGEVTADNAKVLNQLTDRMALVVNKTTSNEEKEITELIENTEEQAELLKTEMYNINLVMCNKNVLKTANGHKVTVYLGFPEGYGPESAGVTFKVYHIKNKNGKKEIEEINCVVTPYGLLVNCDSFSPFVVAAVKMTEEDLANKSKNIIVTAEENGVIEGIENNLISLKENENVNLTIKANNGYQIDSVTKLGAEIPEAVGKDTYNITINYEDIAEGSNIVNAVFVAKTVAQVEENRGETVVAKAIDEVKITNMPEEIIANVGEKVVIEPTVTTSNGIDTYQWYKDGIELVGQTNNKLTLDTVKANDEGTYMLVVTSTLDALSKTVRSTSCKILTSDFEIELESTKKEIIPGEVFEVNAYLKNLRNIREGLVALTGKLEFDTSLLEIYKVNEEDALVGEDGWNLSAFNDDNFKFVADNGKYIDKNSHVFTIYLKVKENITTEQEVKIALIETSASGGNGVVLPVSDAEEKVNVVMEEEKPYFTSEKYIIDDALKIIKRIIPNSTVTDFRNNVNTNQTTIFTNSEGHILADTDIIKTGTKINVGKDLEYTLVVTSDIDEDGITTVNDLAMLKLHLIEKEKIEGIFLIAADIDGDGKITINDIAQLKLILINKYKLK